MIQRKRQRIRFAILQIQNAVNGILNMTANVIIELGRISRVQLMMVMGMLMMVMRLMMMLLLLMMLMRAGALMLLLLMLKQQLLLLLLVQTMMRRLKTGRRLFQQTITELLMLTKTNRLMLLQQHLCESCRIIGILMANAANALMQS